MSEPMNEFNQTDMQSASPTAPSDWIDTSVKWCLDPPEWRNPPYLIPPKLPPEMEDFHLCELLGSGTTGAVYKSIQTREFAVKVFPWKSKKIRELAKREYEVGKQFDGCETTVHVLAYYEHDSSSFILQEIGTPILDYFARKKYTLRLLLQSLKDLSQALAYIHSKGYTHFDVKPSNVLMIKERAHLGDFSHCLHFMPGQEYAGSLGTDVYMATEIKPGGQHSGLEDIYSLGITMYALLMAGALPFNLKMDEIDRKNTKIHSFFIHPDLLSIIQKAASFDPADRYQTFEDFTKDIQSFMDANDNFLDEEVPTYHLMMLQSHTLPLPYDQTPTVEPDPVQRSEIDWSN